MPTILVDSLWPRGLSKEKARVDLWVRDVAPSRELRRWFDHRPERWDEFKRRYAKELETNPERLGELEKAVRGHRMTFLFASREERVNNARALKLYLEARLQGESR